MENLNLSIYNVMSILSLFAVLLFIFQLYLSKKNKANKYFSFYLINISVIISFFLILDLSYQKIAMVLLPLFTMATLSIGPILWLYVNSVVGSGKMRPIKHLVIPLIFGSLSLIILGLIYIDFNEKFSKILSELLTYITIGGLTIVFVLQNGYYVVRCLKLYKKHLSMVGEVFSYTEKVNLSWLKLIVYGYLVFILCLILSNLLDDIWSDILFNFMLLGYIVYSGYNAINYEPIFIEPVNEIESEKGKDIDVKNPFFTDLKEQLLKAMNEDKLFLDDSITIHSLAKELNTNSKYLSQLINNDFNKSFVVFINEYRIQEAKRLLLDKDSKHLSIEGIGYESGFKSKSAFNVAFKKFTGETPSSFLK